MEAQVVYGVNITIAIIFFICYSYQMIYLLIGFIDKKRTHTLYEPKKLHKFAVLISARNEHAVIGELLESIRRQDYPKELLHVFLVADNCTDNTAEIGRRFGATVYERFNKKEVGKGYALNFAFRHIFSDPANDYEAFIILDADNLLEFNYVTEMNRVFDQGYRASTSYRNSKNYAQNWITSGYGLWFMREAEYLNRPRSVLHSSCAISGTGFFVAADLLKERGGWNYHTLTEDIEFSAVTATLGDTIGYAGRAVLYDEQPITFAQSWRQRIRWAKGFYQVLGHYGGDLLKGIFSLKKHWFSCFDMLMNIMPALFIMLFGIIFNACALIYVAFIVEDPSSTHLWNACLGSIVMSMVYFYMVFFVVGVLTTLTEWNNILANTGMKIRTIFTFPLFMLTYIPIAIAALFKKVEWTPIEHTVVRSIDDMKNKE